MGQFDSIHTGRLLLRRWRESDREPFAELNGDPQTLVFFPHTLDRAASDALIDRVEANFEVLGYGLWALEVKETGRFIGFTGLAPMPADVPGAGGVEIGWRLARRAWHHGYATEAARAALRVAFDGVDLDEIWSITAVLNEPSQAVMRRLGMTEVARFEHPGVPDGHPVKPHVAYHLARDGSRGLRATLFYVKHVNSCGGCHGQSEHHPLPPRGRPARGADTGRAARYVGVAAACPGAQGNRGAGDGL